MKRHSVLGAILIVAAVFSGRPASAGTLTISPIGIQAMFKSKTVHFKITNGTGAPLTVRAGKNTLTLEPDKTIDFILSSGDEVVVKSRTRRYDEGQVLVHVNEDVEGHNILIQ